MQYIFCTTYHLWDVETCADPSTCQSRYDKDAKMLEEDTKATTTTIKASEPRKKKKKVRRVHSGDSDVDIQCEASDENVGQ